LVAVEGDLVNVGGESVGVVAECVFDRAEDPFGWGVGEGFGHLACPALQHGLEPFHEVLDADLTVVGRCGHRAVGVSHGRLTEGICYTRNSLADTSAFCTHFLRTHPRPRSAPGGC
jgi:hypothetical protein